MAAVRLMLKAVARACARIGNDLCTALRQLILFLGETPRPLGFVWAQLKRREVWRSALRMMLWTVGLFMAGVVLLLLAKRRTWEACIFLVCGAWLVPLGLICAAAVVVMGCDKTVYTMVIGLCIVGLDAQLALDCGSGAQLILHFYIAATAAMIAAVSYYYLCMLDPITMISSLGTLSIACYGILFFSPASHGTRAWAGGLQLTEMTKLFCAICVARAATLPEVSDRSRTAAVFRTLAIHAAALIGINELSTLGVIVLCAMVILFLSLKDLRWSVVWVGIMAGAGYVVFSLCEVCAQLGGKGLLKVPAMIYRKVTTRMTGGGDGYQAARAAKALILAGWGGSEQVISVPAAKTDFALISVAQLFGVTAMLCVTFVVCALLLWGLISASRRKADFPAILALSCLLQVVAQFILNLVSELGGPIIGVGAPFISLGGTNLAFSAFCVGLALAAGSGLRARESVPFR